MCGRYLCCTRHQTRDHVSKLPKQLPERYKQILEVQDLLWFKTEADCKGFWGAWTEIFILSVNLSLLSGHIVSEIFHKSGLSKTSFPDRIILWLLGSRRRHLQGLSSHGGDYIQILRKSRSRNPKDTGEQLGRAPFHFRWWLQRKGFCNWRFLRKIPCRFVHQT